MKEINETEIFIYLFFFFVVLKIPDLPNEKFFIDLFFFCELFVCV